MHGSSGNTLGVVPRFNINLCDFSENVRSLLFYSITACRHVGPNKPASCSRPRHINQITYMDHDKLRRGSRGWKLSLHQPDTHPNQIADDLCAIYVHLCMLFHFSWIGYLAIVLCLSFCLSVCVLRQLNVESRKQATR